jgi:putative inorganic carbon (hco3(-)) transporter
MTAPVLPRLVSGGLVAFALLALSVMIPVAALAVASFDLRQLFLLGAGATCIGLAVLSGRAKDIFLFFYAVSITYNRQYYSFDWLHGDLGVRGLYWCPSDIFLLLLLATWFYERARGYPRPEPTSSLAAWFIPLLAVATISTLASSEPVGSTMELLRLGKLAVLLVYLRYNLDGRAALIVVAGLAAAVCLQGLVSALQVAFGTGQGGLSSITASNGAGELAYRASGTLGHPNLVAPYLLLIVPGFAAMAVGLWRSPLGLVSGIVAAIGVLTVVLTQSRAPIVNLGAALSLLMVFLLWRRLVPPVRAVGVAIVGLVVVSAVAIPLAGPIHERLVGDFQQSVEFRDDYNKAAIGMWQAQPFVGRGPNSFVLHLDQFSPRMKSIHDMLREQAEQTGTNVRTTAPVHNVYLLILAELGLFGLLAFGVFFGRAVVLASRSAALAPSPGGLFSAGLCFGLLGMLFQQIVDYSLWWDPLLFTLAVLMGVCARLEADRAR